MIKQTNRDLGKATRRQYYYNDAVILNYEIIGSGNCNILFIHGFAASLDSWNNIRDCFTESYRLILVDLKGYGNSSKPDDKAYSAQDQAVILSEFIKYLKLENLTLIGHSFGGAVSILTFFALKDNKLINKLVLIDPTIYLEKLNISAKLLKAPLLKHIIMYLIPDRLKASFTLRFIFNKRKDTIKEKSIKFAEYLKQPGAYKAMLRSAELMVPFIYNILMPLLNKIDIPVFIIWGEKDKVLPVEMGIRLNKEIKNSELAVIPECGHVPQNEAPEETARLIKNFLT